jgi:hypothetical protein
VDLANFGPAPLRLERDAADAQRRALPPIRLAAERIAIGTVRDDAERPVAAARVTPAYFDEVLGQLRIDRHLAVSTDKTGAFRLRRLAQEPPPHSSLVLLVEHSAYAPRVALDLAGRPHARDRRLSIALGPRREIRVSGLPASLRTELFESLRHLPPGVAVERHELLADEMGVANVRGVGDGQLWLRSKDGKLLAVQPDPSAPTAFRPVAESPVPPALAGVAAGAPRQFGRLIVAGHGGRFDAAVAAGAGRQLFSVVDAQRLGQAGSRLFLLAKGSVMLLGEYDGSPLTPRLPAEGDYQIVAIGPDGSVGVSSAEESRNQITIETLPPGTVDIAPELRPADLEGFLPIEFEMLSGFFPGLRFVRIVDASNNWQVEKLMPGNYRVTLVDGQQTEISVLSGGRSELTMSVPDNRRNR